MLSLIIFNTIIVCVEAQYGTKKSWSIGATIGVGRILALAAPMSMSIDHCLPDIVISDQYLPIKGPRPNQQHLTYFRIRLQISNYYNFDTYKK